LEDGELLELDFNDTSALADPNAFRRRADAHAKPTPSPARKEKEKIGLPKKAEHTPSPAPAPAPAPAPMVGGAMGKMPIPPQVQILKKAPSASPAPAPVPPPGPAKVNGTGASLDKGLNKPAVVDAVTKAFPVHANGAGTGMKKNEFVRELYALIQTDQAFVDDLYRGYLSRAS
jgi:hypothetical protein